MTLDIVESGTGRLLEPPRESPPDGQNRFHPGDVLFSKLRPYLAKSLLVRSHLQGTGEFFCMVPEPLIEQSFLFYTTLSRPWLDLAEMTSFGAKMPRTSWEAMASFRLPLVSLSEQRRIADFLDDQVARIDAIVSARQDQSSALAGLLLELTRCATTRGPSVREVEDTGIPWMPQVNTRWPLRRVSSLFRTGSGTTPSAQNEDYYGKGTPWVTSGDLRDQQIHEPPQHVTQLALRDHSALRVYPAGTLVVAMYGATAGRAGVLATAAALNQACCALTSLGEIDTWFAFYWFVAHRSEIMLLASGAGQPNLSQQLIRSLRLPTPAPEEQRRALDEIERLSATIWPVMESLSRSVTLLEEYKQSLITAAISGEFDVSTASSRNVPLMA